jgi:type III restriction enzyme
MAPNLTVYNKLKTDFSEPAHRSTSSRASASRHPGARVVTAIITTLPPTATSFRGHDQPVQHFKAERREPGRQGAAEQSLKECLGDSYFNHLANLPDLVLLMDESHHYRADRGLAVINELNPILGLELTATPQVERAGGADKFQERRLRVLAGQGDPRRVCEGRPSPRARTSTQTAFRPRSWTGSSWRTRSASTRTPKRARHLRP